jgi:hypothetical protein
MVGDYISTSFSAGRAVTVFPVGRTRPTATSYDQAIYAPTAPLAVAGPADATRPATTAGAGPITGIGTGETHQALRND